MKDVQTVVDQVENLEVKQDEKRNVTTVPIKPKVIVAEDELNGDIFDEDLDDKDRNSNHSTADVSASTFERSK